MTDTTTTESTAADQPATTDEPTLETVCEQLDQLTERVEELEAAVEQKDDRIEELEGTIEHQNSLLEALRRKASGTRAMVTELQSRELEKNAHL